MTCISHRDTDIGSSLQLGILCRHALVHLHDLDGQLPPIRWESFRTGFPGVQVPRVLRDQYPEEMTIVLQHQFWGLEVTDEDFSVLLSFGGSRQQVVVPFAAVTAFADPSADFGLRFDATPAEAAAPEPAPAPAPEKPSPGETLPGGVIRFDPSRRR